MNALPEVIAPPGWRAIDFISDLHLASDTPRTFEAWRDYLRHGRADAVFILGDLFEAWVGDDARRDGFEARAAEVLTDASARRPMFFMVGNRDFLLGTDMLDACGVGALADPTVLDAFGQRALLTHGDAWCLADVEYQEFRRRVRDPAWQAQVLAKPLADRRAMARGLRSESERRAAENAGQGYADVDRATAIQALEAAAAQTLVHGHTHRPASEAYGTGLVRHVLSDWDVDHAVPARADVLRWTHDGWSRLAPADAAVA